MIPRTTTTLAALLLLSLSSTGALAQPVPAPDPPAPDKPAPDKPAPDKPAADPTSPPVVATPPAEPPAKPPAGAPDNAPVGAGLPSPGPEGGEFSHGISVSHAGFSLWPVILVQAQVTPYVGEDASFLSGDIAERPGFRLRRARFGFGGSYRSLLRMEIISELASAAEASFTLPRAWIGVTPKSYFNAYMGILDVPFSRSALTGSAETALIERPFAVRAMAPSQQMGALVGGSLAAGKFQYSLGVFNGFQRSDLFYSGYRQSLATLGNRFDNLAYAARVATSLDSAGPDIPNPGDTKNRFNAGASYFFSDGGSRDIHSVEGDVFFQREGVRLLAEVLYSATKPEAVPTLPTVQNADINSLGIVVEGGYTLMRTLGGHLRFEWIDPNTAVNDNSDNWLITAGVSVSPPFIDKFVKAQLEFTHREEVHGKSLDNDALTLQTQFVLQ